jgi:hypothetical protein
MRRSKLFVVATVVIAFSFAVAHAEGDPQQEQMEMMQKWQAYMTPGEPHASMAEMVGDWEFTIRMWMAPGAPPQEATGTATFELVMGGRYLIQKATSSFMGQPFHGMGVSAYDNMKKKYQSMWIDNMGTGVLTSEGTCEGTVCTYWGETPDVMIGEYKRVKSVSRQISDDEMAFEMYDKGPDGKEYKNLEMVYHRK